MKLKKIACLLLALIAVFTIAACKKEEKQNEIVIDMDDPIIKQLDIQNFNGYEFRILTRKGMLAEQYVEEQTGDIINDAIYSRNATVEALYNVKITATETNASGANTEAVSTILAGDDAYDIILSHYRSSFSYATQELLINYNDVKSLKLDNPWWSQDIRESCNVNGNLYVIDGDISLHRLSYAMTLYFNKRLFDDLGMDYPYQLVLDGKWTFDEFTKMVKRGAKDLNGDGLMDPENDRYGFETSVWQSPISILYSGGNRIYGKDAKGVPIITLTKKSSTGNMAVDIMNDYFALLTSNNAVCKGEKVASKYTKIYSHSLFTEGRALFNDYGLSAAQGRRNMEDDFGILPIPKKTEKDNYATIVNGHASLVLMPITVEDPERTGAIMEALCAIGSKDVVPAFYETSLKTKFARDYESEEMIDIIKDSIIYDLGYLTINRFNSVGHDIAESGEDFMTFFAARETTAKEDLKNFNKQYGKMG